MKGTLIILCFSMGLVSCGKLRTQRPFGKILNPGIIAGLEEPASGMLSKVELPIALRICNNLLAKKTLLKTNLSTTPPKRLAYNFSLERRDCNKKIIESKNLIAEIVITGTDLEYNSADSSNYFIDTITDTTPVLEHVCKEIVTADPVLEEKQIKNSELPVHSDKLYFVKFAVDDKGFDTIQINTKIANSKGGYDPQDVQLISIYTNPSQVSDVSYLGIEKERSQYVSCKGSAYTSEKEIFSKSLIIN